jgi:hypothetical protein
MSREFNPRVVYRSGLNAEMLWDAAFAGKALDLNQELIQYEIVSYIIGTSMSYRLSIAMKR